MTVDLYHHICDYLRDLTVDTPWQGHIFAVGGCCRDEILGLPVNDVDLAVDLPDGGIKFAEWLVDNDLVEGEPVTYPMFGTAMLRLRKFPDDEIEIVQTRREKYKPGAQGNPTVSFGSLKQDCLRRDLTVNSLYRDIYTGEILDFTGRGVDDINNRLLRTPDDPDVTFDDDPVRILRCLRFSSRLGWPVDTATYDAIRRNIHKVTHITRSRMRGELNKMLLGDKPVDALRLLRRSGALSQIIPEISPTFRLKLDAGSSMTAWNETLEKVADAPLSLAHRWAALLGNIGKYRVRSVKRNGTVVFNNYESTSAKMARSILHRYRYDRDFVKEVSRLISGQNGASPAVGNGGEQVEETVAARETASSKRKRRRRHRGGRGRRKGGNAG